MTWLRIAGLAMIALSCSIGGICHGARYQQRISALERARTLISTLRHTLSFTLAPPRQLLDILLTDPMFSSCDYLAAAADKSKQIDFTIAWEQSVMKSGEQLEETDRRLLSSVGGILGTSDLDTQIGQMGLISEQLDALLADARACCEKNRRLSVTLGSLLGLSLAVILF